MVIGSVHGRAHEIYGTGVTADVFFVNMLLMNGFRHQTGFLNMEKRSGKETLIRVLILLAGLTIAHLGVTLFLLADLGADPFNVLVQGIFRTLGRVNNLSASPPCGSAERFRPL